MALGPGVGGDATIYLTTAGNLAAGEGLVLHEPDGSTRLLPYFPPLYPMILGAFEMVGLPALTASKWLNVLLYAALVVMAGWVIWRRTRQFIPTAWVSLSLALSPLLITVFWWTMSEPLALWLGFAGLICLEWALEAPAGRWSWLVGSALLAGLSFLTRYSSIAFVLTGLLMLLSRAWHSKMLVNTKAFVYGVLAMAPMAIWLVIDLSLTNTVASRSLLSAGEVPARLAQFFPQLGQLLLFWLLPESLISAPPYPADINTILAVGIGMAVIALVVAALRRRNMVQETTPQPGQLSVILAAFIVLFTAVILLTYLSTYPPITIGGRMFSPLHVAVLWLAGLVLPAMLAASGRARMLVILALIAFVGLYGLRVMRIVNENKASGLGYNALSWQRSQTIDALRAMPDDTVLVTNETNAILYLTGRVAYPFKEIFSDRPLPIDEPYGRNVPADDPGQALFASGEAELVLFDTIDAQFAPIYGGDAESRLKSLLTGLDVIFEGDDGGIYADP